MTPTVSLRHRLLRHVIVPLALTWLLGVLIALSVDITADMRAGVCLSVLDNGPGIGAAERERLLRRWSQGQAGEALGQGSGLGLAIVAEYARILGATFSLDAGEEGIGLRASLRFQPSAG